MKQSGDELANEQPESSKHTVEFVVEGGHIIEARGIDLSETGIGFEASTGLIMALTVSADGEEVTRQARLVRVEATPDGDWVFGLEFL